MALLLTIAVLASVVACSTARAVTTSTTSQWLGASDGRWDDSTRWSTPQFPNNGFPDPADRYNAVIDAAGAAYQVHLVTDITLDKLTINSADAKLTFSTGTLRVRDGIELLAGELLIFGGTNPVIRDTHLTVADGAKARMINCYIDNFTLSGTLGSSKSDTIFVQNDLNLDSGHFRVENELYFLDGEHAVNGNGKIELDSQAHFYARSHSVVTLAPDVLVTGNGSISSSSDGYVINNGVLRATYTPYLLRISGNFENRGRIEVTDRGPLQIRIESDRYQWKNDGVITMDSGELTFIGNYDQSHFGTIHRSGGTIVLGGTVDNVGKTLQLDAALGSCELAGEIVGGTVETLDGTELYVGYSYPYYYAAFNDGVTLNGRLRLQKSARMTIRGGITLNGRIELQSDNRTELIFEGSQTIAGIGEIAFTPEEGGGNVYPSGGILTIGREATIRTDGDGGILGRADETETDGILNFGTISAETAGKTIRMAGANFGNWGLVQAVGGGTVRIENRALRDVISGTLVSGQWVVGDDSTIELGSASILTNNGDVTLRGPGSRMPAIDAMQHNRGKLTIENGRNFSTTGDLDNMGSLFVGRDCTLQVGGDYIQQGLGVLTIQIAGLTPAVDHGLFDVNGDARLDGKIEIRLADGYEPGLYDTFDIIDFQSLSLMTSVDELLVLDTLPGGLAWDTSLFPTDGSLSVVPEPSTFMLGIIFLLSIVIWNQRLGCRANLRHIGALSAVSTAIVAGLIGCRTAMAVSTDIHWQNAGVGDWFDPLNWDTRVPVDGDAAYIDNGGTAQVVSGALSTNLPDIIYVGYDSSGTLEHTAGEWQGRRPLRMGLNPGSSGTYKIGGTAVASFDIRMGYAGDALIEQTGAELSSWEAYVGSNGKMQHSGGTYRVSDRLYFKGDYELSGTGHLDIGADFELGHGASLVQTGGTLEAVEVRVEDTGTNCRMENGEYSAGRTWVREGTFVLNGGVMNPGRLFVDPEGSFTVNGGTLAMSDYVSAGSHVSFQPGNWLLDVRANTADFGRSTFADLSAASFTSQPNTLTLFPAGVDTSQFANYAPLGLVHVAGTDLYIRSTDHIVGQATITDHLIVEGSLDATTEGASNALNGIEVRSGGEVNLAAGMLVVNDHRSGMDSGVLKAKEFYVGKSGSGSFIHTGGRFDDGDSSSASPEVYVGYGDGAEGYYELSGTGHIDSSYIHVGSGGTSRGHFKQLGGKALLGSRSVSVAENSTYELIDGRLRNWYTSIDGHFIQDGGYNENDNGVDISASRNATGLFELRGGTHAIDYGGLNIGRYVGSTGTYILSGNAESFGDKLFVYNGLFRQEGGAAGFGEEVTVRPHSGRSSRIELVDGDFSGGKLVLAGDIPQAAVFAQTGGSCTLEEMFLGSSADTQVADAAVYAVSGGELEVTGTAKIGKARESASDRPIAEGVLEIGNASATFRDIIIGEDSGYGGSGTLRITDAAARMRVTSSLKLGGNVVLTTVPGSSVRMGGLIFSPSAFENESTNAASLAGLGNLVLLFDSGPYPLSTMEVAGEDLGPDTAGLTLNFALDALNVGGDDVAHLQLIDAFDNQDDGQLVGEALYVRRLVVGPDSWLDLNGLNVYFLDASIDPRAIVMANGGTLTVIPEPSTLVLLGMGAVGLLAWRRRRRARRGNNKHSNADRLTEFFGMLKEDRPRPKRMPDEDFAKLYEHASAAWRPKGLIIGPAVWWRALLIFARYTGWRISEILSLRWQGLDLQPDANGECWATNRCWSRVVAALFIPFEQPDAIPTAKKKTTSKPTSPRRSRDVRPLTHQALKHVAAGLETRRYDHLPAVVIDDDLTVPEEPADVELAQRVGHAASRERDWNSFGPIAPFSSVSRA